MASNDLSTDEWRELYRYLLQRLQDAQALDLRVAVETAAAAPLEEESSPDETVRISSIVKGDVGKAIIRPKTPEEAFLTAVHVLESRLVEVPALAHAVADTFDLPPDEIVFRPDYDESLAPSQSEPVGLGRFLATDNDTDRIRSLLSLLSGERHRLKVG
jgi:hypothetical protein